MNVHFGYLKAFPVFLSALFFAACGSPQGNDDGNIEDPIPINLTISGPSVAQEGEVLVLRAIPEPLEDDIRYVWSQVDGEPVDWVQTEEQIEVLVPRVHEDSVFTFEVFAISEYRASSSVQHSVTVTDVFDLQSAAQSATVTAFASTTRLLQYGNLVRSLLSQATEWTGTQETACANGGLYSSTWTDSDADTRLSEDDSLLIEFRECRMEPFEGILSGHIHLQLTAFSVSEGAWSVSATVDDLAIGGDIEQMNAVMAIAYSEVDKTRAMSIDASSGSVRINDVEQYSFTDYKVTRTENLREGTYEVATAADIVDSTVEGSYSFDVASPFVGHFNEYPHDGSGTLSIEEGDQALLESNFVVDSAYLDVIHEDVVDRLQWNILTRDVFWSMGNNYVDDPLHFRSDNFNYVGLAGGVDTENTPLDASFVFAFSRPIENVLTSAIWFEEEQFPYDQIAAVFSMDGATLTVTPVRPLQPGTEYNLGGFDVAGDFGQSAVVDHVWFTTSNALAPVITVAARFYRYGDTPLLSAEDSEFNEGQVVSYQWAEVSDTGVVFDTPNEETTSFTVPADAEGDIVVELTLSNELGDSASAQMKLTALSDADTFIALDSEPGDYIGGGNVAQYVPEGDVISSSSTVDSPQAITLSFDDGEDRWRMSLAAPNGESLTIQAYENAERYPFQPSTSPGFSFTGNGRGCNQIYSDFEILELEYGDGGELSRLAVNFVQRCESPTAPALKGVVRFNSASDQE